MAHNCFTCGELMKNGVTHFFRTFQGDRVYHTSVDRRGGITERREGKEGNFVIDGEKVYTSSKNSTLGTKYKDRRTATESRREA